MQCVICKHVGAILTCSKCNQHVHYAGKCSAGGVCFACNPPTNNPLSPRELLPIKDLKNQWDTRFGQHEYAYVPCHENKSVAAAVAPPLVTKIVTTLSPQLGAARSPAAVVAPLHFSPIVHHISPVLAPAPMVLPSTSYQAINLPNMEYSLPPIIASPQKVPRVNPPAAAIPPVTLPPPVAPVATTVQPPTSTSEAPKPPVVTTASLTSVATVMSSPAPTMAPSVAYCQGRQYSTMSPSVTAYTTGVSSSIPATYMPATYMQPQYVSYPGMQLPPTASAYTYSSIPRATYPTVGVPPGAYYPYNAPQGYPRGYY